MNLFDSSFLCLDIGTYSVRGVAHRVKSGNIAKSAIFSITSDDTVFAIKSVVDELEQQLGTHFDIAYITGNFGRAEFSMTAKNTIWESEHKINGADINGQISQIQIPDGFHPMHIIPMRYDTMTARNLTTPIGFTDRQLISVFGTLFYENERAAQIYSYLRRAHIMVDGIFDGTFLIDEIHRDKKQTALFINLGAESTTVSIWTGRGPVFFKKIPIGQFETTKNIASELGLTLSNATMIKHSVSCMRNNDVDRFTPADVHYDFTKSDINDILATHIINIVYEIKNAATAAIEKYNPTKIFLSGGGANIDGIAEFMETNFNMPVQNLSADAMVNSLSQYIWNTQTEHVRAFLTRREKFRGILEKISKLFRHKNKKNKKRIPIMPSTLCFNMKSPATYELFRAGNISMIHVDIMDGFYINRIVGNLDELKHIREHTNAHLYVHLMTESPSSWATAVANSGADTIVVSAGTAGVKNAIAKIHELKKRAGIAINPDAPVGILKPVLRELDDVLIMSVIPGASGQEFDERVLEKISALSTTRKKYSLKFKISVDGGINPRTAKLCWGAGADYLISGSYLARAADFPLAVQRLVNG